ncbi:protein stoned-B-like [Eurosta solidaginis]|uniref:protein stoned-B-like n=1 Tax=Eurosta solidaginis TaxID=178769 RepID=UPI003530FD69
MLKLPKGLKKKKKKSKKDQELFTEEELEQYKRELKAKQETAAAKSDAGESDAASDVEGVVAPNTASTSNSTAAPAETNEAKEGNADTSTNGGAAPAAAAKNTSEDEEWVKFKALTSGVDSILHKTQDELDRIKKESFYQRLPSAAEKKKLEEEEAARREALRLEEEQRKAAEKEAQRDKLAEAVVELSDSEVEEDEEVGDIFATDYIEAITSGEVQLAVVPESPVLEFDDGPDPFDTAYAEKVIVGADKAKGNKKLVSLGAAVEVLSGRVDREHALALAKPKRKLRKGIQNLLLSESIDLADQEVELAAPEPQKNLLDELVDDVPGSDAPIDLSVSLHLHLIQQKKPEEEEDEEEADPGWPYLSEFDTLKDPEDDEFAELAAESLTKKEEVKVITQISLPPPEVLSEVVEADWAEFEQLPEEQTTTLGADGKVKPARPPPPARPPTGAHIIPGAIYVSDDEEENADDDPFNTAYAEQVIRKTTVLEEDDDFDPRAEEKAEPPAKPPPPAENLLTQLTRDLLGGSATELSKVGPAPIIPTQESEEEAADFDPFDTSAVSAIVQPKATELKCLERELLTESNLTHSLSDPDFDPRADEADTPNSHAARVAPPPRPAASPVQILYNNSTSRSEIARRKSSLSLNVQSKSVGFLVPSQDLLGAANDAQGNKKPLTPYYAPNLGAEKISEQSSEDPFDTSYVPDTKPTEVELKHLEQDLLAKSTLKHSLSDPDFDPRAPPTPVPAEDLLAVKENIKVKVLTPSQESKDIPDDSTEYKDPFDTSIASNLQPGRAELKQLESELLPTKEPEITTGVLDTQTDAQELGLGDKVLTPSVPVKQIILPEEVDPFDTSIAENLAPGATEIKLLESELIEQNKMANPFLMDDDLGGVEVEPAPNPFFSKADVGEAEETETDNPFASQSNPFAFGDEPEESAALATDIDPAMSFFGTTIEAEDDTLSIKSTVEEDDETTKRAGPPPRPVPPQTQQLINTVSNQMEETSSELLGRIPATRSPSPVSMRDLHSPSPTPDSGMADLLDVSDSGSSGNMQGFDMDSGGAGGNSGVDNPFGAPTAISSLHGATPVPSSAKQQPPRPPPPRPVPPRPAPPSGVQTNQNQPPPRPTPPVVAAASAEPSTVPSDSEDLFDMFGTTKRPKPPPPKTKEDILSLFEKPAQPVIKPDLLSDDLVLEPSVEAPPDDDEQEEKLSEEDPIFSSMLTRPDDSTHDITCQPQAADLNISQINSIERKELVVNDNKPRAPTPDIEITTVEDLPRSDDEDEPEPAPVKPVPPVVIETEASPEAEEEEEKQIEKDTTQVAADPSAYTADSDHSPPTESAATTQAVPESSYEATTEQQNSELEQMDTGLDFAPLSGVASGAASANPFASPDEEEETFPPSSVVTNIFAVDDLDTGIVTNIFTTASDTNTTAAVPLNIFAADPEPEPAVISAPAYTANNIFASEPDEFDAFSAKFDSVKKDNISILDGFGGGSGAVTPSGGDAWGNSAFGSPAAAVPDAFGATDCFENEDDGFYAMKAPVRADSVESVDKEFSVVIRPKGDNSQTITPQLAPPPPPARNIIGQAISGDTAPAVNPFEDTGFPAPAQLEENKVKRTDSQDTPQTPLYDEDVSQPLEDFPRLDYVGPGWEMQLRQPNKKKITGQRFWKKIFVRLVIQNDAPVVQLLNQATDKQPFQELPLQSSYSVSDIGTQQYDQFGKIFTVKLQYIFYKERPGVRPGQVTKAERITNKLTKFAQYAIAGDYEGVKEFGSDLKKLGLPVEHAPQSSQLFKIGSMNYEDMKQFSVCIEEALFKLNALRERALTYKMEEVQVTAVDEIVVEQDFEGKILKQIARVRLFFLAFLTGMPTIELGVNDMWRQGKEVVGRHDIIPVATEEWIRLEAVEFHSVVNQEEYEKTRTIKFQPPDANYIELLRFRVRPPKNRELPLQLKATWCVTGNKVELRADILVPGFTSRKLGQIPCEDVSVRFPIPECWIYLFRVEKHFRYGSVKSAHRRTGKIKGIERILGAVDTLQESLIEVTSGQAKYEHHHRAIVWRCPRLPKEGQGAYTTHQLVCRMALTSYDQIPSELAPFAFVEFTMPATQVSHTTVRSVSVQDSDADEPPEKYVRYLARHEYKVGIETTHGESTNAYLAATRPIREEPTPTPKPLASPVPPSDSDTDSN